MSTITQAESEAIIRLVLAGRRQDGKVSLPEGDTFAQQIAALPWTSETDRQFFVVTEAARIRKTLATRREAFVTAQCAALRSAEAQATVLRLLEQILAADGLEARERDFVASIRARLTPGPR